MAGKRKTPEAVAIEAAGETHVPTQPQAKPKVNRLPKKPKKSGEMGKGSKVLYSSMAVLPSPDLAVAEGLPKATELQISEEEENRIVAEALQDLSQAQHKKGGVQHDVEEEEDAALLSELRGVDPDILASPHPTIRNASQGRGDGSFASPSSQQAQAEELEDYEDLLAFADPTSLPNGKRVHRIPHSSLGEGALAENSRVQRPASRAVHERQWSGSSAVAASDAEPGSQAGFAEDGLRQEEEDLSYPAYQPGSLEQQQQQERQEVPSQAVRAAAASVGMRVLAPTPQLRVRRIIPLRFDPRGATDFGFNLP